jgi:hypothetical protein
MRLGAESLDRAPGAKGPGTLHLLCEVLDLEVRETRAFASALEFARRANARKLSLAHDGLKQEAARQGPGIFTRHPCGTDQSPTWLHDPIGLGKEAWQIGHVLKALDGLDHIKVGGGQLVLVPVTQ